jgi:dephospho-CoA kinase
MKFVGLTGGVGMGKSACSTLLEQRGIPVIDTDKLARELVEPGESALAEIRSSFGDQLLDASGALRRSEFARLVFSDPHARKRLEEILHPRIRERWKTQGSRWKAQQVQLGVVVIPLLFETKAEQDLDVTVCVACSAPTQLARLQSRGWPLEQIRQRIAAQMPAEQKMALSDFIIWNEADLDVHAAQLDRILNSLGG